MEKRAVFIYPGFLTKGLKGRILWHPARPYYNTDKSDWSDKSATDLTSCVHDPWPSVEGGEGCVMETGSPR